MNAGFILSIHLFDNDGEHVYVRRVRWTFPQAAMVAPMIDIEFVLPLVYFAIVGLTVATKVLFRKRLSII